MTRLRFQSQETVLEGSCSQLTLLVKAMDRGSIYIYIYIYIYIIHHFGLTGFESEVAGVKEGGRGRALLALATLVSTPCIWTVVILNSATKAVREPMAAVPKGV